MNFQIISRILLIHYLLNWKQLRIDVVSLLVADDKFAKVGSEILQLVIINHLNGIGFTT